MGQILIMLMATDQIIDFRIVRRYVFLVIEENTQTMVRFDEIRTKEICPDFLTSIRPAHGALPATERGSLAVFC